jgi:hypothetical protein
MSLFSSILHRVFGRPPAAKPAAAPLLAATSADVQSSPAEAATPVVVDVEAVLSALAVQKGGGGNWRSSIVDLLKMLDLDSSLAARKQLADELGVRAGADGSAEQNMALSRAVWQQLAEHGGRVPDSLKG